MNYNCTYLLTHWINGTLFGKTSALTFQEGVQIGTNSIEGNLVVSIKNHMPLERFLPLLASTLTQMQNDINTRLFIAGLFSIEKKIGNLDVPQ